MMQLWQTDICCYRGRSRASTFRAVEFDRGELTPVCFVPRRTAFVTVLILFMLYGARPAAATIRYQISLANPEQHVFHVEISVPNPEPGMKVALPAWNALYQIRDFAYRVRDVEILTQSNSEPRTSLRQIDKQTW